MRASGASLGAIADVFHVPRSTIGDWLVGTAGPNWTIICVNCGANRVVRRKDAKFCRRCAKRGSSSLRRQHGLHAEDAEAKGQCHP